MKNSQDDVLNASDVSEESDSNGDLRRRFAEDLPLEAFFTGSEQTFATLGRTAVSPQFDSPWKLSEDKRETIRQRAQARAQGKQAKLDRTPAPEDLLALAGHGSARSSDQLSEAIRRWWQQREHSPLWQTRSEAPQAESTWWERLADARARRFTERLRRELGFEEETDRHLFKTEAFSRRTVYTRDYAAIPRALKALFKMTPQVVFAPRTSEQLARLLRHASKRRIPVAPRGRGTWALGGALLTKGGVVLELANFEKKIQVDPERRTVTVSASVDFEEAEQALNQHGLTLKVRPSNRYGVVAGFLSVGEPLKGGLGLNAFGHGHVRGSVKAIRVVTADGRERRLTATDPDFPYFLGTNGRYGVLTEVTLEAAPRPARDYPVALQFETGAEAFDFLQTFEQDLQSEYLPARPVHVEFFGRSYLTAVRRLDPPRAPGVTVNLLEPEAGKRHRPPKDTVLFVFNREEDAAAFSRYLEKRNGFGVAPASEARELWHERFAPMKLRKKGDLLTAEMVLPLARVADYLAEVTRMAADLGVEILPVVYVLKSGEALVLPQFLTDRRRRWQYYRHFSLIPVLGRLAVRYGGRPYGYGIWLAGLSRAALGRERFAALRQAKKRLDPHRILNPGKLDETCGRFYGVLSRLLLNSVSLTLLEHALKVQRRLSRLAFFKQRWFTTTLDPYVRERGDALHRCIKCSACMVCPLAQIWERSGDPKLRQDAIYITPRFKMEYMQRHLYEGKKLTQADVDRFVLCFRCGVAERETVCPISDLLLEVEKSEGTPCQKKLPTYDEFEARLRREGYDVDGAIQRYLDLLKTHPGVGAAMNEVLGRYRVPKSGDLTVLQPKTDFALYRVEVDEDRCLNCGKCGDEHTTSQRGFWDPRNPRKMVSLDDLLRDLDGKIPKSWFSDAGGPIPAGLKAQGRSHGEAVYFTQTNAHDPGHQHCNGCLYCVIECPVDAIRVGINPYYAQLHGEDFTREDVRRLNEEARTGGIPTSGTGSTGLFGGRGFDRFMFDFSVIVRPTRDGIREAIDIGVNLGRKPVFHLFEATENGALPRLKTGANTLDLPTPVLLELPVLPDRESQADVLEIFGRTAAAEGSLLLVNLLQFVENLSRVGDFAAHLGLRLRPQELPTLEAWSEGAGAHPALAERLAQIRLLEIEYELTASPTHDLVLPSETLRARLAPDLVVSHRLDCPRGAAPERVAERVAHLAEAGAEIVHLNTRFNPELGAYEAVELIPAAYERLLAESWHTQLSLMANGIKSPADLGIAMMLGASAVVVDRAALVALNHEFPMLERQGCPLPPVEVEEGVRRLRNLFTAWHKQIREVLGAFGVRDIRRTVGERGRLIDLREREQKMRAIVEDRDLRRRAQAVNREKVREDGELARKASWKYSELGRLVRPVPPPNANLLGNRRESLESMLAARGDRRWNADLLTATWLLASGTVPSHRVPQTGQDRGSGSFDVMKFAPVRFEGRRVPLEEAVAELDRRLRAGDRGLQRELDAISISAGVLNPHRRPETPPCVNHFPIDAADMSLGSIGWKLTLARYLAGAVLKRFTGTGEGGYPLERYDRLQRFFPNLSQDELYWLASELEQWVATQTATGYFGVTEDTIRRAKKIVLKFAQGAKPGLGGHILGAKVTAQVEDLRGVIAGISVFSPFPFHDVYSIEDVTKMIEWLRTINPDAIISVKISTPVDVYHVALGLVTGGADEIQIDATAGGTGAAPDIARNRIAMPLEYGLSDVHKFLVEQGERNKVALVASGGLRSAYDVAKALILGADKVVLGTQEIVSQQCNRCGNCEAPGGCQKGITTTVEQLEEQKEILLNAQWLVNSQVAMAQHLIKMMYVWGVRDLRELRGRTDLISEWGWTVQDAKPRARVQTQKSVSEKLAASTERQELDACGVVSFACTKAVPVESIQTACQRMHNRGNGRGGGILGLGGMFAPELEDFYALQLVTLVPEKQRRAKILEIVNAHLRDFEIYDRVAGRNLSGKLTPARTEDFRNPRRQKAGRDVSWQEAGLNVDPGDLYRFFVRVRPEALLRFAREVLQACRLSPEERAVLENGNPSDLLKRLRVAGKWIDYYVKYVDLLTDAYLDSVDPASDFRNDPRYRNLWRDLEDEFIYRTAFAINQRHYIEPQDRGTNPEAFVVSMMKDGGIWKLVGYAEQAADYWILGDAQYVPVTSVRKALTAALASRASDARRQELVRSAVAVVQEFRQHGQIRSVKRSRTLSWKHDSEQLELTLRPSRERPVTLTVPRRGRRAVLVYKYGAHIWIGHQRFPTVFSPFSGGSHPFYGRVYEALIHNGDFANYVAMVRFWAQFGGAPQFRTDTEMAAKAYAILKQMGYPLPHVIEALAPTRGIDLERLRKVNPTLARDFETLQKTHIAGSPDGPWFFIIGDQDPVTRDLKVVGLTDTSVLRPSVFVWQESPNGAHASIGLVGSEEQACRSVLDALFATGVLASNEPDRVRIVRGGSIEQDRPEDVQGGGALVYHLRRQHPGRYAFAVTDKFGHTLNGTPGQPYDFKSPLDFDSEQVQELAPRLFNPEGRVKFKRPERLFQFVQTHLPEWEFNTFRWFVEALGHHAQSDPAKRFAIDVLTLLRDRLPQLKVGEGERAKRRSALAQIVLNELYSIFDQMPSVAAGTPGGRYHRLTHAHRGRFPRSRGRNKVLVVDARGFPPEGHDSLARTLLSAYERGWRKFIVYRITGQRYLGAAFGPHSEKLELHLYGSPGQDIANSIMGGTVHVHADAQNDMAKIMHSGTVVVHGLAGNTGVYGAKGGEIFVRDSVGTRWVINSVSSPAGPGLKVVIVGSAMEYLAESLMGGLVLVLGLRWDDAGVLRRNYLPFAGNSILAGASAGKVILYDPDRRLEPAQFEGARDIGFLSRDWIAVYRNLVHRCKQTFGREEWRNLVARWRVPAQLTATAEAEHAEEKRRSVDELVDFLQRLPDAESDFQRLRADAVVLKSLVEERFTGKEWRNLVRQLGLTLHPARWPDGLELLERMMDWREVVDLLRKTDRHFHLGLEIADGHLYLPIDGQRTRIQREDFRVLRPLKPGEKPEGSSDAALELEGVLQEP